MVDDIVEVKVATGKCAVRVVFEVVVDGATNQSQKELTVRP